MDSKPVKAEPSDVTKKTPDRASPAGNRNAKSPDGNNNNSSVVSSPQQSSLPLPPTASPTNSVSSSSRQHHATPIMTNSASMVQRPPSSSSVHSNTSGNAAARTTTTSRRGGRTRCRSPPAMTNRPGSSQDFGGPSGGGGEPYNGGMDDRRNDGPPMSSNSPPSPANPSPHAAAAAAAAKALSSNGSRPPPPSSWYNDGPPPEHGGRDYNMRRGGGGGGVHRDGSSRSHYSPQPSQQQQHHHHRHHPPHHHHHSDYHGNSPYPGQSHPRGHWPADDDGSGGPPPHSSSGSSSRRSRDYGQFIHRRTPPPPPPPQGVSAGGGGEDRYGYREGGYHSYSGRGRNGDRYGPYDDNMDYERRYPDHPPPPSSSRNAPPPGYDERMSRRGPRGPPPPSHPSERNTSPIPPSYGGGPPPSSDHHHPPPHHLQQQHHQHPHHQHHHSPHPGDRDRDRDRDRERGSRDGGSRRGDGGGGGGGGHGGHHGSGSSSGSNNNRGDPYYNNSTNSPGGMAPLMDGGVSSKQSLDHPGRDGIGHPPSSVKRTTRVIGTPTPIHVPRASDPSREQSSSSASLRSRGGSNAESVFRDRPPSDLPEPPRNKGRGDGGGGGGVHDDDTPQQILRALQTPTSSYDEKPSAKPSGSNNDSENKDSSRRSQSASQPTSSSAAASAPLSPQDPPQIQHLNHQNASETNLFFEPQRSPKSQSGPPQPTSSIEMAPSFSLFNQSFDSFGEQYFNVVGPLDSALQSTSFGAIPTGSTDKGDLALHRSMSGDKFSQQLLGGSGSGALTFGMSPSNSFGGGNGSTILLGGQDPRSTSPTQVLGMYRSYSGGGSPRPKKTTSSGPLEELRMSGGSFGPPSIGHSYTRSFGGEGGPPPSGPYRESNSLGGSSDGSPVFYSFLKKYKAAFKECSFLLPGLKAALSESSISDSAIKKSGSSSNHEPDHPGSLSHRGSSVDPSPQDLAIAVRRIASAVCAFGGTIMGARASLAQQRANGQSIFREKEGDTAAATSSSTTSQSGSRGLSRQKVQYDEKLPSRYYENDNRLSWEFEENPPVEDAKEEEESEQGGMSGGNGSDGGNKSNFSEGANMSGEKRAANDSDDASKQGSGEGGSKAPAPSPSGDQPKMRYRCKLCGQPKQNHTCPYQQSLARSIGANVYPAVNAFTSAEPGILAPALSEMNNFIASGSESVSSAETSPSRPTPDRMRRLGQTIAAGTAQVTPESMRGIGRGSNSPISAMSAGSATPQRSRTPGSSNRSKSRVHGGMGQRPWGSSPGSVSRKKRTHSQMSGSDDQGDLLFVESMELKPEQFRIVTQSKTTSAHDAFTYPALPLPYAQRKRLSDNLFSISKQVPQLTDECAAVLREAREKDLWDLAVAELMTQVVVVVNCEDGDARFEGLRRYLLTLGIAC